MNEEKMSATITFDLGEEISWKAYALMDAEGNLVRHLTTEEGERLLKRVAVQPNASLTMQKSPKGGD